MSSKTNNQPKSQKTGGTAQNTIPFYEIYDNNMLLVDNKKGSERYCICCRFSDTNYSQLRDQNKLTKLDTYRSIFNALSPDIHYQELYVNSSIAYKDVEDVLIPNMRMKTDYEKDYTKVQKEFALDAAQSVSAKEFYLILSYVKQSPLDSPYNILTQNFRDIQERLSELGSSAQIMTIREILQLMYNLYNPYNEDGFLLPDEIFARGTSIKDYIAPSAFKFESKHTVMGDCYNKVFFIRGFASELSDSFVSDVMNNQFKIAVSKHVKHIDKDIALKTVEDKLKGLEMDNQTRHKKNQREGTTYIPYHLKKNIDECKRVLDMIGNDQELFEVGMYISVSAKSLEELENICKIVIAKCRGHLVSIINSVFRQEDALASIMPLANDKLNITHYLLSDGLRIIFPFTYENIFRKDGLYYGKNIYNNAPVILDKKQNKNGNSFILGIPGSGKSMFAKMEINDVFYKHQNDRIIILDIEREFYNQCKELGGEIIKISPDSGHYINPFDIMQTSFEDEDVINAKSELMLSLMYIFKNDKITAKEKTIIDRCVRLAYKPLLEHDWDMEYLPTLPDFYKILQSQKERESSDLALYLEMYVHGSVNIFSHKTNVDFTKRCTVFDLFELGTNLKRAGMVITAEFLARQVMDNWINKIDTHLIVDEIQMYFDDNDDEYSPGSLMDKIFARYRKRGCFTTGITQNAVRLSQSKSGATMLENSQFIVMFEQSRQSLEMLAKLYDLSERQQAKLFNPKKGEGIIVSENTVIPFSKLYPKGNKVYSVITTDPKDNRVE